MDLETYLGQPGVDIDTLAANAGTKPVYLRQIVKGHRKPSHGLARAIEVATNGRVTRQELRPDIFGPVDPLPDQHRRPCCCR